MNKWKGLLTSRKFWSAILGIVVSLGILEYSDEQQAELVGAIIVVVTSVFYILGVAIEDGMTRIAESQRLTKIQDALKDYTTRKPR